MNNGLSIVEMKVRGCDASDLTFSWRLASTARGRRQSAWTIRVAETAEALSSADGEAIWIESSSEGGSGSTARYDGPPLAGNRRYWWSVDVRDERGGRTVSAPSAFDTALAPADWKAQWIWKPGPVRPNDFAYFRKTFAIAPVRLERARLFVSAHHYFQLFANGTRVGGYGSPAPTLPTDRKLYLTYDIAGLLRDGENAIGVIVHYLGGSGQNYVNGAPGLIVQGQFDGADGTTRTIVTDETWEVVRDIPHRVGTPYQQNRRISAVEQYDARRWDGRWLEPDDRGRFVEAVVIADRNGETWPLRPQELPEGAAEERIVPAPVGVQMPGRQVFDAGKIVSGWPSLRVKGFEGVTVRMRYSEALDEEGGVKHNVCNETSETYYDEYTMAGRQSETWEPDLSYKAFRYVEVTGYPEPLNGDNVRIVSAHTDVAHTGSFASSNALLDAIYAACIQTQKNNVLGQLVDCPHREQAQYLADADLQAETLLYFFDGMTALDKLLADFEGAQRADGTFPFVFPSNVDHPDFAIDIPEWDLHFVTVLWKMYRFSGDSSYVSRHYAAAKRLMDGVAARIDETGLVPKGAGWHISDWPYPTIDQEGAYLTAQNLKSYRNFELLARMAELLGLREDAASFAARQASLGAAIRERLYDETSGLFLDCSGSERRHQGVNVLALEYGLVPEERRTAVLDYIVREGHQCKTLLSLNLLRALFENGREEDAYRLLNHTQYPGWGYMIAQGSKTIWEGFDDIESHSHAWNAYPARLFVEYIVGIRIGAPGFATAELRPWLPEDIRFAEGSVLTPAGRVQLRWERIGERELSIEADIPANGSAALVLPWSALRIDRIVESGRELYRDGAFIRGTAGIAGLAEAQDGSVALTLGSGSYSFTVFEA
ncbi:family 78 glycoside hydrolase catalytic domain [Paenibacillus sp.]|uniref:family 78 glycoside hydrolase catalytic domain n=1 Tax=Paenibacillus sp. TaxID=58172 RepID=UPI0028125EC3|nr:family 78 glycoside hydrolase catalytic domain [Paenibacillus sp.]